MLYLASGDINNQRYVDYLQSNQYAVTNFLAQIRSGKIMINYILNSILTNDTIDQTQYDNYMITLTLADLYPTPMSIREVMPWFFALQVNYHNSIGETRGHISSFYNAYRLGATCRWNFREYAGHNSVRDLFEKTYQDVLIKFDCMLNSIILKIPIVKEKKYYMIDPDMETPCMFTITGNTELATYQIPKSMCMNLFVNGFYSKGTPRLKYSESLVDFIDKSNSLMAENLLLSQDFQLRFSIDLDDDNYYLDEDSLLIVNSQYQPKVTPNDNFVYWEPLRPFIYRLMYNHKFYVTMTYGNHIKIMCQ